MSTTASASEVERPRAAAGERRREALTYWAYRLGERVINLLPRWLVLPLAAAAGNAAHDLTADKRAVVRANLAHVLQLPADHPRVRRAARRAFRNYAKYLVDVMRLETLTQDDVGSSSRSTTWSCSTRLARPSAACCCAPCTSAGWT